MNVFGRFQAILESDLREEFLKILGHRLGVSAREIFADSSADGLRRAGACNEMMIALWTQLYSTDEAGAGYPDGEFLSVLLGKADAGDVRGHLRNALESALLWVDMRRAAENSASDV
ncbi:hypothetical protein BJF79_27475 [Actinomadura sp. CNU-125]|uniref:hypothetical protein n=1 Tax=Actinomadura sp. CNU-125 TaxID=1904961 RepID=UPI00095AD39F|nr:hypothetical protein [Actinomadura sp. CNU-125]OLT38280.1 hypothetical protein BJF79_27475 [Actinomadura sp. CNU-125]